MTHAAHVSTDRPGRIGDITSDTASRVLQLRALAGRGLAGMYSGDGFPRTMRGARTPSGTELRSEGDSLRYTVIAALGLDLLPHDQQCRILRGGTAGDLVVRTLTAARDHRDTGALALALWAAGEVLGTAEPRLLDDLRSRCTSDTRMYTVDCAWALTAALAVRDYADTSDLVSRLTSRILAAQGPGGLFPHTIPATTGNRFRPAERSRRHVGSFADQVYPLQALARTAAAVGDPDALAAANATAACICALQGTAGQWWWHYDSRGDSARCSADPATVVERFPVYSVHQHAMAPMALFDLRECGGDDHVDAVERGIDWLFAHPETLAELVSERHNVVWRKVGRREPRKAVRSLSAVTTSVRPGVTLPWLDRVFPPGPVDYECRPYELGWLLYAWLTRK